MGNERKAQELVDTLNEEQRYFLDQVVQAIYDDDGWKCFFLDGPGGSGKTYLYNTLMYFLRSKGKSVLGCATTGIAADLLIYYCVFVCMSVRGILNYVSVCLCVEV